MTFSRVLTVPLIAGMIAGCSLGPRLADFPSASGPQGAFVRITVPEAIYLGELLETRVDSILILSAAVVTSVSRTTVQNAERRIRLVPFARIESLQFQRGSKFDGRKWSPADAASRERFRLLSRFPQGLSPELLQQLLKMYGQTDVIRGLP